MLLLAVSLVALFCAASAGYCARVAMRHVGYRARWRQAVALLERLDVELTETSTRLRITDTEATRLVGILERERGIVEKTTLENARQLDKRSAQVARIHQAIQHEIDAEREGKRSILERNLDTIMARRGK